MEYTIKSKTMRYRRVNVGPWAQPTLAGKAKKTAIIACMRKLLIIMNAMIKKNQMWLQPEVQLS
jgi:transposase